MEDKKVLFRITNLKQYFPLSKKGMYVKANDGISVDIYQGETFGLVGESGCGKSTFGRTILELYKQTDGRTMYYGRTIEELAPEYVRETIKDFPKLKEKLAKLRENEKEAQEAFDNAKPEDQGEKYDDLLKAKHAAESEFQNLVSIFGGFYTVDNIQPVQDAYMAVEKLSIELNKLMMEKRLEDSVLEDYKYENEQNGGKESKVASQQAKCDGIDKSIADIQAKIAEGQKVIDDMRAEHKDDPEFQKYEAMRDEGIDLARLNKEEMRSLRSDLQIIFQDPYSSLNPRKTVGQIIGEGMIAHNYFKKNSPRLQEQIQKTMNMCGIADYFIHRYPHQFSGGQRQRIGIARALSTNPKFVICDEAVSALDVSIQSQIINLLQDLKDQNDLTYLFITHDLSVVKYISDRIGVMYLGTIVELSESQELFDHPLHPYTEALLSAIPTTNVDADRELVVLEGDIPSPVNPPKGCKFNTRCKYCTDICTKITPEFKEVRPNHFVACHHMLGSESTVPEQAESDAAPAADEKQDD